MSSSRVKVSAISGGSLNDIVYCSIVKNAMSKRRFSGDFSSKHIGSLKNI